MRVVQPEQSQGDGTHIRTGNNTLRFHSKVFGPMIYARIEQAHSVAAFDASYIATLGPVAEGAAEGQVVLLRWTVVFLADHMIHMQAMHHVSLVQQAIFADLICTSSHLLAQ